MSNIKTESEMTILTVKYDLEEQFKNQKVGTYSFPSQKFILHTKKVILYVCFFTFIRFSLIAKNN